MTSISDTSVPTVYNSVKVFERLNQHIAALIASLGGFAFGVSLGWNSSASETLRNILTATITEIGIVGAIVYVGAFVGLAILPIALRHLSRTGTMFLTVPVFIIGWTCICFANQRVSLLILGRLICGLCGSTFCVLTPIYVGEIAQKEIRGRLLTFFQLMINCGIMFAYSVAHVLQEHDAIWRYSLTCAVTVAPVALTILLPESPLYHLEKDESSRARKSMYWLRDGKRNNFEKEMEEFEHLARIKRSKKVSLKTLKNKKIMLSFLVSFGVMVVQQLNGIHTLIFYSLTIFNLGGSGDLTGSQQTLVVGAVQIVSCILATILIDLLGRRVLLIVSSFFMGLFLMLLGWFFRLREIDPEYDDIYSWMPPTWFTLFFAAFNIGVGPISWVLLGESFPTQIKVQAAACAAFISWLVALIVTLTFLDMLEALGIPKIMWLFGAFCWMGTIFCAIIVKETKGKSLANIQEQFDENEEPERASGEN